MNLSVACITPKQTHKKKSDCTPEEWAANLEYRRLYNAANKAGLLAQRRAYREENADKAREAVRKWRAANPAKAKESSRSSGKKWRESNLEHCRLYRRKYERDRRRTDCKHRVRSYLSSRLWHVLKRASSGAASKPCSTMELVGCGTAELVKHLESQFQPGMTWDNWGNGEGKWHIDHVIPFAAVDIRGEAGIRMVCNYKNLRPMWGTDNLRKGSRVDCKEIASHFAGVK